MITLAESLGGYESLAELPYLMTHASIQVCLNANYHQFVNLFRKASALLTVSPTIWSGWVRKNVLCGTCKLSMWIRNGFASWVSDWRALRTLLKILTKPSRQPARVLRKVKNTQGSSQRMNSRALKGALYASVRRSSSGIWTFPWTQHQCHMS